MSGVVKAVKKVFKAVVKVVKKIAKPLAIAAAVYFTGGLALSAFGPTQAFAASLPGFGISASGAATGIFSKAASTIGLSGGLQAGAAASAGSTAAAVGGWAGTASTGTVSAAGGGAAAAGATAAKVGMSLGEKLMLASVGTKAVGAFLAPTLDEQHEASKQFRGAFYGTNPDGSSESFTPTEASSSDMAPSRPQPAAPVGNAPEAPSVPTAQNRQLMPTAPQQQTQPISGGPAPAAPVNNEAIAPKRLMQEGVRYV